MLSREDTLEVLLQASFTLMKLGRFDIYPLGNLYILVFFFLILYTLYTVTRFVDLRIKGFLDLGLPFRNGIRNLVIHSFLL